MSMSRYSKPLYGTGYNSQVPKDYGISLRMLRIPVKLIKVIVTNQDALLQDGRSAILCQDKKPGAPILGFGSIDMDSQMRGGWRWTVCLVADDVTDAAALMRHDPYIRTIGATKWFICRAANRGAYRSQSKR